MERRNQELGELVRLRQTELRTSGGAILNGHGYQYNLAHQRTLLVRTNSAYSSWNGYVLADYDPAGQLTHAWTYRPDGTPVTGERWSYGYDAAQNLARRTNNTTVESFGVNVLNQLTTLPNGAASYDRRGNLVSRTFSSGVWYALTYTYDHENQLTSVATDTTSTYPTYRFKVEFGYDGAGRLRVKKDYTWSAGNWALAAENRYLYDGLLLVQERNASNTPRVTYTRGRDLSGSLAGAGGIGGLLARSHGYSGGNWTSHNFYHADGNGNVTALVNSAGTLQASYKYDPYGRWLSGAGSLASANVLRFSSKPWVGFAGSTTDGLYSYGYRFYDPSLQRWPNRDPIGERGGMNLYGFVGNSPLNKVDHLGLDAAIINHGGYTEHTSFVIINPDGSVKAYHFYAKSHQTGRCCGLGSLLSVCCDKVSVWSETSGSLTNYLQSQQALGGDVKIVAYALGTPLDDQLSLEDLDEQDKADAGIYSLALGIECHKKSWDWFNEYLEGGPEIHPTLLPGQPWPPYWPERWFETRRHRQQSFPQVPAPPTPAPAP